MSGGVNKEKKMPSDAGCSLSLTVESIPLESYWHLTMKKSALVLCDNLAVE